MLNQKMGERLKAARLEKGLSLQKLAARVEPKTSWQAIQKLEAGERPITMEWIERISAGLGMPAMDLLMGREAPPREGLTPQVATDLGETLASLALGGKDPPPHIVSVLAEALQEITATFLAHPAAYRDSSIARPVLEMAGRRASRQAS